MQPGAVGRLEDLIKRQHGEVSKPVIRKLSARAHVQYTTIARFLGLLTPRTKRLRNDTAAKLAVALDTTATWLLDGQGSQQLQFWPLRVRYEPHPNEVEPVEQVQAVLSHVAGLPKPLALKACRAAVAAVLDVVVSNGAMISGEAYECLVRLDAQHRAVG